MKVLCFFGILVLFLAGCGDKLSGSTTGSTNAGGSSPLTAPVDYLGAAAKAQQNAVKTVDTTSLNKAIQLFNVEKGRNPKDLNELVPQFIPQIPAAPYGSKIVYDANAGTVSVVKQ
jgi:hypothetical protein